MPYNQCHLCATANPGNLRHETQVFNAKDVSSPVMCSAPITATQSTKSIFSVVMVSPEDQ